MSAAVAETSEQLQAEKQEEVKRQVTETRVLNDHITCHHYNVPVHNMDSVEFNDMPETTNLLDSKMEDLVDELRDVNYYVAAELALISVAGPSGNYLNFGLWEDKDACDVYDVLNK